MCTKAVHNYLQALNFVTECYKTQNRCDKAVGTECFMIQEMRDKAVNSYFFLFDSIPDQYKTQEMCDRAVSDDPF